MSAPETLCEDCPPVGYPTDKTRCLPCPRRMTDPLTARLSELLAKANEPHPDPLPEQDSRVGEAMAGKQDAENSRKWRERTEAAQRKIVKLGPQLLAERAILIAEREEARALLEPFAKERLSMEPTVSDCLLRSAGAEMRLAAEKLDARDNAIRAARAYLTRTEDHG